MHHWNQVVNIHGLHLFNVRHDGLELGKANVKVDFVQMPLIKGVQLQETPGKSHE